MSTRRNVRPLSGPARDQLLRELAATPGVTRSSIGRDPRVNLSRERVRQLMDRLGLSVTPPTRTLPPPRPPRIRCMSPAEFRAALERAGLSQVEAARRLGVITGRPVSDRTVRRWCQEAGTSGGRRIQPDQQRRINRLLAEAGKAT